MFFFEHITLNWNSNTLINDYHHNSLEIIDQELFVTLSLIMFGGCNIKVNISLYIRGF